MQSPRSKFATWLSWAAQIVVAVILLQTLYFKFLGAPESRYIFSTIGSATGIPFVEPWGRLGLGVAELGTAILLLVPDLAVYGALLTVGLGMGAIFSHLAFVGVAIVVDGQSDGGLLFALAVTITVMAALILLLRRSEIPFLGERAKLQVQRPR